MTSKDEVAALMASDGDYEKKISLLKKAVVSVTKQKQEAEKQIASLQEELATATRDLNTAKQENSRLQKRVSTLEAELEQERRKGNYFGQNVLKGLSTLMTGADGEKGAGVASGGGQGTAGPSSQRPARGKRGKLNLSPEDVERLVTENESLHMQLYEMKNAVEEASRITDAERDQHRLELSKQQSEASDFRTLLKTATDACDSLNAQCVHLRAMSQFSHHFLLLTAQPEGKGGLSVSGPLSSSPQQQPLQIMIRRAALRRRTDPTNADAVAVHTELVEKSLKGLSTFWTTLLSAVSVLLASLRESLPRAQKATVGELRCFADRIATLQEAHSMEKERLQYLIRLIDDLLHSDEPENDACRHLMSLENDLLAEIGKWIGLIRLHLPLLVDSCVAYLPPSHAYVWHRVGLPRGSRGDSGAATDGDVGSTVERDIFVEEVVKCGYYVLGSIEGSLDEVKGLLHDAEAAATTAVAGAAASSGATASESASAAHTGDVTGASDVRAEWLLALQRFWWEGCAAQQQGLRQPAGQLARAVEDVASACGNAAIRDTLQYISKCLYTLLPPAYVNAGEGPSPRGGGTATHAVGGGATHQAAMAGGEDTVKTTTALSPSTPIGGGINCEELLHALAAADRAAVLYYTQMNLTIEELADKEDEVRFLEEEAAALRVRLDEQATEGERTRQVLQEQIQALSDQLMGSR